MQVRDLPIFFLVLVFAGLLLGVYYIKPYKPVVSIVPVAEEEPQWHAFTGRVVMPSLDDMYVLGNSAARDPPSRPPPRPGPPPRPPVCRTPSASPSTATPSYALKNPDGSAAVRCASR